MRLTPIHNTGVVPPHVLTRLGGQTLPANGNTGVVPPYLQDKLQNGGCFPHVPTQKDPSGVDIVFSNVKLPKALVNLTGEARSPHLAPKTDRAGLQLFSVGVKLPN